jgi:methenyltetrahydrofolate cyclohydrolase
MEKLIDLSVSKFVEAVASKEPAPGGGSVAALAGALGGALSNMVANLSFGKKFYNEYSEDVKQKVQKQFEAVESLRKDIEQLIDKDTEAYNSVMAAFKMPKETDEQKSQRSSAIQASYKLALEVPLKTAEKCLEVLELQNDLVEYGNPNAITDIGVCVLLCHTGVEGAILNVKINLSGIKDEALVQDVSKQCTEIIDKATSLRDNLMKRVYEKL